MKSQMATRTLARIAETQRGLVTTRQAALAGVLRVNLTRLEDDGAIERITHGVYRVAGAPHDQHEELRAHWLALDPGRTAAERLADKRRMIAASHRSAADVHGIGNLYADDHTYTASYPKQSARAGVRVSQREIDSSDVQVVDGMLITTPERTIADLRRTEPDQSHVADALGDAIVARKTSRAKVVGEVSGRSLAAKERAVDQLLAYSDLDSTALARRLAQSMVALPAYEALFGKLNETLAPALEALAASESMRSALEASTPRLDPKLFGMFKEYTEAAETIRAALEPMSATYASDLLSRVPWETLRDISAAASLVSATRDE